MPDAVAPSYQSRPWPVLRNAVVSLLNAQRAHSVQGMVEIDVTDALQAIGRAQKRLRCGVSFQAYMLYCVVQALLAHPLLVSYRWRNQLVTFEDIDVLIPMEKKLPQGGRIPVAHVVRGAQGKSLASINWELRQAAIAVDLATEEAVRLRRRLARWPRPLRDLVSWHTRRNPFFLKRLHGTVILTAVQPPGLANAATVLGPTIHTLSLGMGTICERVKLAADGTPVQRKMLVLGGAIDHDVVDGMTAARFVSDLTRLVEGATALDDAFIQEALQLNSGATA